MIPYFFGSTTVGHNLRLLNVLRTVFTLYTSSVPLSSDWHFISAFLFFYNISPSWMFVFFISCYLMYYLGYLFYSCDLLVYRLLRCFLHLIISIRCWSVFVLIHFSSHIILVNYCIHLCFISSIPFVSLMYYGISCLWKFTNWNFEFSSASKIFWIFRAEKFRLIAHFRDQMILQL